MNQQERNKIQALRLINNFKQRVTIEPISHRADTHATGFDNSKHWAFIADNGNRWEYSEGTGHYFNTPYMRNFKDSFYKELAEQLNTIRKTVKQIQVEPYADANNVMRYTKEIDSYILVLRGDNWADYVRGRNKILTPTDRLKLKGSSFGSAMYEIEPPKIEDLLYSLVLDCESTEMSLADWCDMFGYDLDSKKAEQLYRACQESTFKLKTFFTNKDLELLQEYFQDY